MILKLHVTVIVGNNSSVGDAVGAKVGFIVGEDVGFPVGLKVGLVVVGLRVGAVVEGDGVGSKVDGTKGDSVGASVFDSQAHVPNVPLSVMHHPNFKSSSVGSFPIQSV